jgi:CHAT domain-containing protein
MDEQRQQPYMELVQALLSCAEGQEAAILAGQPELLDEGLVMTALAVAQMLAQPDGEAAMPTVQRLVGFATNLAQKLGIELPDLADDSDTEGGQEDLDFLNLLIQAEMKDKRQVPQLFAQNLDRLTPGLGKIMQWLLGQVLATQPEAAEAYSGLIENIVIRLREFPLGNRAQNLEIVLAGYTAVLQVRTPENNPEKWAQTQNNRANAYLNRIAGDRAQNLEEAIKGYEAALEIYTKQDFPIDWAMTQNNRASAYSDRIAGDRAQNLEEAIKGYEAALEIRTKQDFPINWAATQNNRAAAYSDRIAGDRGQNLEEAIKGYEAALEIYTKKDFPIDWAMTQNNRASAYSDRIAGDRAQNLEEAIKGYEAALEIRTKQDFPIDWAMTQNNRANAYLNRIAGDRAQNLEEAFAQACIEEAIKGYAAALEIYTPEALPIECLKVARALGNLHFKERQWLKALVAYETAMTAAETSRSWNVSDDSRQRVLREALSVYENAIQAAVELQDYPRAIQYTERVHSRQLVELMASKDLYADAKIPPAVQEYLARYQNLSQEIDQLRGLGDSSERQMATSNRDYRTPTIAAEKIFALEAQKQELYQNIRSYDPILAGQIQVAAIGYEHIQALVTSSKTALLTVYSTDDQTHIFILKQGQDPILFTCEGQGYDSLHQWLIEQWMLPYHGNINNWRLLLPELLIEIADRLQLNQLISQHLTDIQELVIIPHLLLHQIPWAALPIDLPTNDCTQCHTIGDRFTIRYAPSCQILQYCADRPPIHNFIPATVEDADNTLIGARYEGEQIAAIYQIPDENRLRGKAEATISNYRQLLGRASSIHSSHHASSRPDNPLESQLILGDGSITLGDLLLGDRYPHLDEVFLSACETHTPIVSLTDDIATLTTGFLCIGARSVQSTLWSVDDIVTSLFDIFYHQERRDGIDRPTSLKRAQIRLRELSGTEFSLSHYPSLEAFVNSHQTSALEALDAQMNELDAEIEVTSEDEKRQQLEVEFARLQRRYTALENLPKTLKAYCQQERPFAHPFYWAAFVCQGMA